MQCAMGGRTKILSPMEYAVSTLINELSKSICQKKKPVNFMHTLKPLI